MAATWTAIGLLTTILLGLFVYLGSKIDGLGSKIDGLGTSLIARIDALDHDLSARIDEMSARLADHVGDHPHAG